MKQNTVDLNGKPYNRPLFIATMLIGTFCIILNKTLLTTAYPMIMKDFGVSIEAVEWLTTIFLLVTGVMIPLSAFFLNTFNSKYLFIITITLFLIGTIICALAQSFFVLILGRIVQGIGAGISSPLLQSSFFHMFPVNERGKAMGLVGLAVGAAPAIGPTLSGYIVEHFTWRYLFYIIIPVLAIDILACFLFLRKIIPTTKEKLDILSAIISIIGFSALLYGFSIAGNKGWFRVDVISLIVIGGLLIVIFVLRQLKIKNPLLRLEVFKNKNFATGVIVSATSYMAMIGFESILPLFIQNVHGKSALVSGLILLPGAVILGLMSPITGNLFDKYGIKYLSRIGSFLLACGTLPFLFITNSTSSWYIIIFYAMRLFGMSMLLMPVTTFSLNQLPKNRINDGTAINNTSRQISSSIGTAILISALTIVSNKHMPNIALKTSNPTLYHSEALQASAKGYQMAFLISFIVCIIAFLCTFLLSKNKPTSDHKDIDQNTIKNNSASTVHSTSN